MLECRSTKHIVRGRLSKLTVDSWTPQENTVPQDRLEDETAENGLFLMYSTSSRFCG